MRVAILSDPPDLSGYLAEILKTWGLPLYEVIDPEAVAALDPAVIPVLVCPSPSAQRPAPSAQSRSEATLDYARRGGTVLSFLPEGALAAAAGLEVEGEKETPLRLRVTEYPAAGLAGDLLPVVGRAWTVRTAPEARVLAYLSHPGRYGGESAAITETPAGQGRIVAFAFDLPLCVLMLRQGDPARAELIPAGDSCARPSHLAAEIGPCDAAWVPFADLLARLFVDLARRHLPAPVPLLSPMPGMAPGLLLYSGDEDGAMVASNEEEFAALTAADARMNLYLIPIQTHSTREDARRYAIHHDLGPHPNLRPLDGRPVSERVAEFERQVLLFEEMFGVRSRSVRNHCTAWAGYLELVEAQERLGIRMDANYFSGTYLRDRQPAPYAAFGAALPMRFCRPDGRLLEVFQQHTHLSDDVLFGTAEYSFRFSPEHFGVILDRIFSDLVSRFHTPYTVCMHPGNWVKFSGEQGHELLRQAAARGVPVWSFDQWLTFWEARDTWRFRDLAWDGAALRFAVEGSAACAGLCLTIAARHGAATLTEVQLNGQTATWQPATRYGEEVALVALPAGRRTADVSVRY